MRVSLAIRQSLNDTLAALHNSGYIRIYDGARPATADTALSGNTLLATLRFGASAYGATDASGVATANAITGESNAPASSTATFCRIFKSDGTTVIRDCSVGTSGAEVNLTTLSIVATGTVTCSSSTLTFGVGA